MAPEGGSERPELDPDAEAVVFIVEGELDITVEGKHHTLVPGGYAFLAPGAEWSLRNNSKANVTFHWLRKHYQKVEAWTHLSRSTHRDNATVIEMPGTEGRWVTTRFVDMADMRHDMHVNIVTFQPGGVIPFAETHVMEHGLYVLEGKAVYRLNQDWVEVEAGDFMWLRAFCPQACYAGGPGKFSYLLGREPSRALTLNPSAEAPGRRAPARRPRRFA